MSLRYVIALLSLFALNALPWCPSFKPRAGSWALQRPWNMRASGIFGTEARGGYWAHLPHMFWDQEDTDVTPAEERGECEWRAGSRASFKECFRDKRLYWIGDSLQRNSMLTLALHISDCTYATSTIGPDAKEHPQLCESIWEGMKAHGDVSVRFPEYHGNFTFTMIWAPLASDVLRIVKETETFTMPAALGGPDGISLAMAFHDIKTGHLSDLVRDLPVLAESLEKAHLVNPSLSSRLVVIAPPDTEPYDKRRESITVADTTAARAAFSAAFSKNSHTILFDPYLSYWKSPSEELLEINGGQYLSYDGLHPTNAVTLTVLRDVLNQWCEATGGRQHTSGSVAELTKLSPVAMKRQSFPVLEGFLVLALFGYTFVSVLTRRWPAAATNSQDAKSHAEGHA
jgi:hypothetical protein